MDQLLLTIAQCCDMAAIGRTKFYELVASGEIPVRKIGRRTLVAAADLKGWAERLPALGGKDALTCEPARRRDPSRQRPSRTTAAPKCDGQPLARETAQRSGSGRHRDQHLEKRA